MKFEGCSRTGCPLPECVDLRERLAAAEKRTEVAEAKLAIAAEGLGEIEHGGGRVVGERLSIYP